MGWVTGQTDRLQQEVDGDHAHESGEQSDDHRDVHKSFPKFESQLGHTVGHGKYQECGDQTVDDCDQQGVEHPARESMRHTIVSCRKQILEILQSVVIREEVARNTADERTVRLILTAECRKKDP